MATREALKRADAARKAAREYAMRLEDAASYRISEAPSSCTRAANARRYLEDAYNAGVAYAERRAKREKENGGKR